MHTFHLARTGLATTAAALVRPPTAGRVAGLHHAECMTTMQLGSPIPSAGRLQLRSLAMFAAWEDGNAVDRFLETTSLGRVLSAGWHVRLEFLRRWGRVSELAGSTESAKEHDLDQPVVAVTLARLKLPQIPRFIRWGKPVERLVRDHPGVTLALAAGRLPRTVSTFTVWRSGQDMVDMVHGHSAVSDADRHAVAMVERDRRDFHHEFTTLRFRPLSEHGAWKGRTGIVPT